jgi:hypothetical protein
MMYKKLIYSILFVLAIVTTSSQAAITPITDIIVTIVDDGTNPPNYWLESITIGTYTVTVDELVTGVSAGVATAQPAPHNDMTAADNFDLNLFAGRANEVPPTHQIKELGGKSTWLNTNGDNPDFFVFETGGNQDISIEAILPGEMVGQSVNVPTSMWGDTGLARRPGPHNNQTIEGIAFAITDLLDQNGNNLTNGSVIEGIQITSPGYDPTCFCAVESAELWLASAPSPADGATDVPRDVSVSWKPGIFAPPVNGHKVYLSENFDEVKNGVGGITTSTNSYAPGRLDFSTTYYWRVDEVNAPPDSTIFKGEVWQFTTEPIGYPIENITVTASSSNADVGPENTVNGSGLDDSGLLHGKQSESMWLSSAGGPQPTWIEFQFDKVYKLHEMWVWNSNESWELALGLGFKDVAIEYSTNGTDYATLGTTHEFAQAPGTSDYAHNTTVDLSSVAAKYIRLTANSSWGGILPQYGLSEVRFLYIPVLAREPSPDSGATDVDVDVVLSWRAGREAAQHDVYLSTDEQAVIDGTAPVTTVADTSYGPLSLDLDTTYYWKVNEVNMAETPTTLEGDLWNFTTPAYLVVDDFESYNDRDPGDPESKRIFNVWIDGYQQPANGSIVGYDQPPFCEQTIVHGGKQSMPLFYNNTGGAAYSEATLTLSPPRDWTKNSIKSLSLWFHGDQNNAAGQLYVKLSGAKVVYDGDAANITRGLWKQWNIDLAPLGAGVQNVTTLSIGIDGNGASGILYFDDIGLHPSAPEPPLEIWIEAEAAASITSPMKIYNDPLASGGQYIGTEEGIGDENNNPPTAGIATYNFTAQGGTYKILLLVSITGGSNSFWVRIPGATYSPGTHSSGWIKFNGISDGAEWHWDEVHSDDHGQQVVKITLPAGQHTLEIARREDGTLLDAILITD